MPAHLLPEIESREQRTAARTELLARYRELDPAVHGLLFRSQQIQAHPAGVVGRRRGLFRKTSTKLLRHLQAAAVKSGLDGCLLHSQDSSDVGDGKLHDLFQYEGKAERLRQRRDRGLHRLLALVSFEKLQRSVLARRYVDDGTLPRGKKLLERFQLARLSGTFSMAALARSGRDSVEPGGGIRAPFELIPFAEREKKGVLHEVAGLVVVAAESNTQRVQLATMPLHELGNGDVRRSIGEHGGILARKTPEDDEKTLAPSVRPCVATPCIGIGYGVSMTDTARILITLGGLLLLGLLTEAIGRRTRFPRVSLMLLFGFVFGRSGLGLIPDVTETWFPVVTNVALVMVGFLLGEKLSREALREHGRLVLSLSITVVLATFVCVFLAALAIGMPVTFALLLAGIAPATDPAATTDVVREVRSEGPFSSTLLGIVALDDAWGLLLFSVVLAGAEFAMGVSGLAVLSDGLWHVGGAVLLGLGLGLPMAYLTGRIEPGEPTLAEALGSVLLCGGLALVLDVSFLLAAMSMGVVVANLARHHERPFHAIEGIEWPFLILFFLFAGTELEVSAFREIGASLGIYVAARIVGRILGAELGARFRTEGDLPGNFPTSMGLALMPQAGVALGMTILAVQRFPEFEPYLSLAIAATVLFEIVGPILTRRSLERMGELSRAAAPGDSSASPRDRSR